MLRRIFRNQRDTTGDDAKVEIEQDKVKKKSFLSFDGLFYIVHLLFFFGYLLPEIGGKVRVKCENDPYCSRLFYRSWLGYRLDTADVQWRDLRSAFPLLWMTLLGTTIGHWLWRKFWKLGYMSKELRLLDSANISAWFRLIVGLIFLAIMHGKHTLIVLVIAFVGYRLTRWQHEVGLTHGKSIAITWVYAIAVLLFKESYRIQHYQGFHFLRPLFDNAYGGMYRWQMPANFLILRIISYNCDFIWAVQADQDLGSIGMKENDKVIRTKEENGDNELNEKGMTKANLADQSRPLCEYNLLTYFSYILYCPLYIAGPIVSFNAFVENSKNPQKSE